MVADAISDPMAALYILRLWAHCQERKSDTFVMPPAGLKAQCKCPADAATFEAALIDAGFLKRDGNAITVLGWAEKNASLIAAWENGAKGGRPKKNPSETHGKPTGNPVVTQGEPTANPGETDKSREEKKREETSSLRSEGARERASRQAPRGMVLTVEIRDWVAEKGLRVDVDAEFEKFRDHTFKTAMTDWPGALRNWLRRASEGGSYGPQARASPPSKQTALEARNAATVQRILETMNAPE